MRLTRLQFVERVGEPAFFALLEMSKQSLEIEGLMKLIEWAEAEADGTSIDLTDPRLQKLHELEPALVQLGVVSAGWADDVLHIPEPLPPVEAPVFVATHTVQNLGLAMVDADGTVRLADGRWTTLDALASMGNTVEAL